MSTFWIAVIVIFAVSFFWAIFSLRKELRRPKEIKKAEQELKREKILFKR